MSKKRKSKKGKKDKAIARCIYCREEKEMSVEHYLPECLGKFKDFEALDDRICHDCNNRMGRELEDQFCHAGEIAFFRRVLGVKGKKSHKKKVNPFERGSSGVGRLEMKGKIPGQEQEVLLQPIGDGGENVEYQAQLIVTTESDDDPQYILIPAEMTDPAQLLDHLKSLGIETIKQARVIVPESDRERIDHLLSGLKVTHAAWEDLPLTGSTYTVTKIDVTSRYFRAIAKIAFHYLLNHLPFRGDEEMFAGIRRFIMEGGEISDFVVWRDKQVLEQIKAGFVPDTYCHIIIARATSKLLWCHLQFFLGPKSIPHVYSVRLADNDTKLEYSLFSGHQFCLYQKGPKDGFDGRIDPLPSLYKPAIVVQRN